MILICFSMMTNDSGHLFLCLYHHTSSLLKCLFMSFASFLIVLFYFLLLSFQIYFRYHSFVGYMAGKYFLPVCSLCFYSLSIDLYRARVLNFDEI